MHAAKQQLFACSAGQWEYDRLLFSSSETSWYSLLWLSCQAGCVLIASVLVVCVLWSAWQHLYQCTACSQFVSSHTIHLYITIFLVTITHASIASSCVNKRFFLLLFFFCFFFCRVFFYFCFFLYLCFLFFFSILFNLFVVQHLLSSNARATKHRIQKRLHISRLFFTLKPLGLL